MLGASGKPTFNHFISKLVDELIERLIVATAAFVGKAGVDDNNPKERHVHALGPVLGDTLLLQIKSVLAETVVLVNTATVLVAEA